MSGIILDSGGEMPRMPSGWEAKLNAPRTPVGSWEGYAWMPNNDSVPMIRRFGKTAQQTLQALRDKIISDKMGGR